MTDTATKVSHLDQTDVMTEEELNRALLLKILSSMTELQKKKILKNCEKDVKRFEYSKSPGHVVWHPYHLQVLGLAKKLIGKG